MELVLVLALLLVLDAVTFPVPGTLRFVGATGAARVTAPDGPFLLPLRPSRLALLAAPALFGVDADGVYSRAPLARLDLPRPGAPPRHAPFADLAGATAAGVRVKLSGVPFLRALTPPQARSLAARLAALGAVAPEARDAWLRARADEDHDVAALRERVGHARAALRKLGWICDGYAFALFALLPLAVVAVGEDLALRLGLAPLAALHVAAVALAASAHRRLLPAARRERIETLLAAALFPPTLLRLPQRLFLSAVGVPPAIAASAALLAEPSRSERLAQALAAADRPDDTANAGDAARVLAVAAAAGIPAERLRRPRERRDPISAAYCPLCLDDYLAGVDVCAGCGAPLVRYPA